MRRRNRYIPPSSTLSTGVLLSAVLEIPAFVVYMIYTNLDLGSYFEFQDPVMLLKSADGTLKGTSLDKWQTACITAAEKLGRL
jgi:hypothetical protein